MLGKIIVYLSPIHKKKLAWPYPILHCHFENGAPSDCKRQFLSKLRFISGFASKLADKIMHSRKKLSRVPLYIYSNILNVCPVSKEGKHRYVACIPAVLWRVSAWPSVLFTFSTWRHVLLWRHNAKKTFKKIKEPNYQSLTFPRDMQRGPTRP